MSSQPNTAAPKASPKKKPFFHYGRIEGLKDFSLALPAILFLLLFTYYPLVNSFYLSFTDWNLIKPIKKFVGFDNYTRILTDDRFYHVLKVTFLYTIIDVIVTLVLGLLLALLFNKQSKAYGVMRLFVFMPYYISMVIASIVFIWILNPKYGVLNSFLGTLGINPVQWLNDPKTALFSLIMVSVWKSVGFTMIIFIGGLRSIPLDYYEASSLDGANKFHQFWHITVPLLSPTTLFLVVTSFISSMQVFQSVDIMTGGGPLESTKVMVMWIYQMAFEEFRAGRSSALVVIFFLIIMAFTALQFAVSKKKVHYEG
ncbi:sugar ABC transporter permease [Paenibacillus sp. J31TS4]|uniref:carbohydrate ABC transporter permease n=1 Tax=Paenibacillus sp. J31TS4 TaxID=2807195 RepID=UPI001B198445|nr:sugar ABC transporter permease [Paenibacillus sp. J31TS4]GIP40353.1 sugar ABC transporter permease [Paenibacillus sp. J31TS4]